MPVDFPGVKQGTSVQTIAQAAMHSKLNELAEPFKKIHIEATLAAYTAVEAEIIKDTEDTLSQIIRLAHTAALGLNITVIHPFDHIHDVIFLYGILIEKFNVTISEMTEILELPQRSRFAARQPNRGGGEVGGQGGKGIVKQGMGGEVRV